MTDETGAPEPAGLRTQIEAHSQASGFVTAPADVGTARRLDLLWKGHVPSTRGRPARFTLADVVAAGMQVADADGLAGVTMRRVAHGLGVGAMSLYTYVPGRDELVDLLVDRAYSEVDLRVSGEGWRADVLHYAQELLELFAAHAWLLDVNRWRMPLAPHVLDAEEAVLRALASTALAPREVVAVQALIDSHLRSLARDRQTESRDGATSGLSNDDWWQNQSSFWETHFDPERFPTMTAMWLAGAFEVESASTEAALGPLLDSVERAIAHAALVAETAPAPTNDDDAATSAAAASS